MSDLRRRLVRRLARAVISPKILLSRFKVGTDQPPALYTDPTYLPFYYYLGRELPGTKTVLEIGFDTGMTCGSFFDGCPGVETFLAFRRPDPNYHGRRIGTSNVHNTLKKRFALKLCPETDPDFLRRVLSHRWDVVLIVDERAEEKTSLSYLDIVWNQVRDGGCVVVDHLDRGPVRAAYDKFCGLNAPDAGVLKTSRGTAVVLK